jgi:chorismate lyase/3-hydroxybenzoate synthase
VLADERVLAVIRFDAKPPRHTADPRLCSVALPELGAPTLEVWHSEYPVFFGVYNGITFALNKDVLFLHLHVKEHHYPNLETATNAAYRQIFSFIRQQNYPHLSRVWNYFPDINAEQSGLERYRAFCRGRYQALASVLTDFETRLPAASAIGTRTPGLVIYGVATRQPGNQIENPRQISAFHYPRRYGPRSPSFSRSILQSWEDNQYHLYISGTASIVGYTTRHTGKLTAQLQEILDNLEALLDTANRRINSPLRFTMLRVYVRSPVATAALRKAIAERFGTALPMLFLHGDICRSALLIEIEGLATSTKAP